ncbi:hypothetical protein [Spirosoma luteum]|uniref:hypothetical protein n=1 Tax=Spirosoma luteum TaxID=431553 RepID=UPI00037115A3|nr:hypothetical protein [Spirosoma luteum]
MKTVVVAGMLVVGSSLQAFSMGQPHNVFAARKHMRTKYSVSAVEQKAVEQKSDASLCWQTVVKATKTMLNDLVFVAFSHISPVHSF